jgi:hypothetical protein
MRLLQRHGTAGTCFTRTGKRGACVGKPWERHWTSVLVMWKEKFITSTIKYFTACIVWMNCNGNFSVWKWLLIYKSPALIYEHTNCLTKQVCSTYIYLNYVGEDDIPWFLVFIFLCEGNNTWSFKCCILLHMYVATDIHFLCQHCFICMATGDTAREKVVSWARIQKKGCEEWIYFSHFVQVYSLEPTTLEECKP